MTEEKSQNKGADRDRAATRRDVDAGVRDRMADDDIPDAERDARRYAARDRMASMRDRQEAARDRAERSRDGEPPDER